MKRRRAVSKGPAHLPQAAFRQIALRWTARGAIAFVAFSILLIAMFRWLSPPLSSLMVQRYLQNIGSREDDQPIIRYEWVAYEAISPEMALAVVAGEDQHFPEHWGFDFGAIRSALTDSADGKTLRGASTISQQVVKNLYLWQGRSWLRKGLEAWFTLWLEVLWPKQRILEVYLNIAELGRDTYGVEAASRRFFRKSALNLNRREAALLAAVLPNPLIYRVDAPSAHVRERQSWILKQMRQLGGPSFLETL